MIGDGLQKANLAVYYGYTETDENVKAANNMFLAFYYKQQKHKDLKEKQSFVFCGHSGEKIPETLLVLYAKPWTKHFYLINFFLKVMS